ncbi:response regulator [Novosphingobium aerophilum]|uniref:response regulator n=1 Tax=Novosphingobium aerophilum TaxID=2839843 RepID=UPI001BE42026|nr:response regulator transcription factor [Novosphingobium aerophilum]
MSRIVVADDHAYLRAGLETVLTSAGHEIVASVGDGHAAEMAIARCDPDIVVLDVRMPLKTGIDILQALRSAGDDRKVVLLTATLDDASLVAAIKAKVDAIVMKDEPAPALQQAIVIVTQGQRSIPLTLMDRAFELATKSAVPDPLGTLSERDRRIAEFAAAGLKNRQIAEQLGLSEGAIKVYLHRIFDKLGIGNRTELALLVTRAQS